MSAPKNRRDELLAAANKFHRAHPEVYRHFEELTFELIGAGCSNYAAAAIFHQMRWRSIVGGDGVTEFKINSNYSPFYARLFAKRYPAHAKFFDTREQSSKTKPPRKRPEPSPVEIASRRKSKRSK